MDPQKLIEIGTIDIYRWRNSEGVTHFPQGSLARKAEPDLNLFGSRILLVHWTLTEIMSHLQDLKAYLFSLFSPQYSHYHHPGTSSLSPFLALLLSCLCFPFHLSPIFFPRSLEPEPNRGIPGDRTTPPRTSLSLLPGFHVLVYSPC